MRIKTEYSTNLVYGKLEKVFQNLLDMGYEKFPIADRNSTFGFVDWTILCAKNGKKPVYGVELGVSNNALEKRPRISYWTFYAKDDIKVINELVALATSQPNMCLTYEQANSVKGAVIIADNKADLALTNNKCVWIALAPSTPIGYFREALRIGFGFIASSDNSYNKEEDREAYRILMARNAFSATYPQHILNEEEWKKSVRHLDVIGEANVNVVRISDYALNSRNIALELCCTQMNFAKLPKIDAPQTLEEMCAEGFERLGLPQTEEYLNRCAREIAVIKDKNFQDYFYVVSELMQWARQRMIVSPGRGSSAGSLVCYLLGITAVDPIKHNLLFERFLDPTRSDLPDIDMDFDDNLRHLVFEHLENVYGSDRFAKIANVTRFKANTIINVAGASLKIPIWLTNKAKEEVDAYSGFDERAMISFADSFKLGENSRKLIAEYPEISIVFDAEYHAKNMSVHAAGAVITDGNILDIVAVDSRNKTVMADKNTAEKIGLLKLDLLGVSQLAVFARALELMGKNPTNDFLDQIPIDDPEAYAIINNKKYAGIFQMGRALINLFKHFNVDSLEDIVAVTSLARPGPLMSGGAARWVSRRVGSASIEYAHSSLEPFLKTTYGELVYQEQLMQIAKNIGLMSIEDVTALRKAVAKSKGAEALRPFGEKFKEGAKTFGFVGEAVDKFWDDMCGFGAYSFNRSHAVSYSLITYYCCWFKAFFPVEFGAASLDAENEPEKQIALLRELHAEGIEYVPIDSEISTDRWTIKENEGKKILVGPLTSIKGIGPAKLAQIIEARATGKTLPPALARQLSEAVTAIDSLTPVDAAVKRNIPDLRAVNIHSTPTPMNRISEGDQGDFLVIGVLTGLRQKNRNDDESLARRKGRRLSDQKAKALNITLKDDSGADILCIVDPDDYASAAPGIIERGGVGEAIYAIKGSVPENFRMISIKGIRFLCNMSDGLGPQKEDYFAVQEEPKEDYFVS